MAKQRPTYTISEIERELGYSIDSLNYPNDTAKRFYSDLSPIPKSSIERGQRELEERQKQSLREFKPILDDFLPDIGIPHTTIHGQDTLTFTRRSHVGYYNCTVDIHYGFGLDLSLLLTESEAVTAITTPKLQPERTCGLGPMFSKVPKEVRDRIYHLAIPNGQWRTVDVDNPRSNFPEGIGDPSGFYFPLNGLGILGVNKQMRQEALPRAFRSTLFRLDDMDNLIKLLIAVGYVGRDNIESLEFAWESKTDLDLQWTEAPTSTEHLPTLPVLHAASCVQLLSQCKNLKFLRLFFDSDLLSRKSPDSYRNGCWNPCPLFRTGDWKTGNL